MTSNVIGPHERSPQAIWRACGEIATTKAIEVAQVDRGGIRIDLSECIPKIQRFVDYFALLRYEDITLMPEDARQVFSSHIRIVQQVFRDIEYGDPQELAHRDSLIANLDSAYYSLVKEFSWLMVHTQASRNNAQELDALLNRTQEAEDTLADITEKARDVAAKIGAASHATLFEQTARNHALGRNIWLCFTFILALVAAGAGWQLMTQQPITDSVPGAVQFIGARLIVIGALSYMIVLAGRSYRSEAHNHVVNKHRSNALLTFEGILESAKDCTSTVIT